METSFNVFGMKDGVWQRKEVVLYDGKFGRDTVAMYFGILPIGLEVSDRLDHDPVAAEQIVTKLPSWENGMSLSRYSPEDRIVVSGPPATQDAESAVQAALRIVIRKQEELLTQHAMLWQLYAETGVPMLLKGFIAAESRSTHSDVDHCDATLKDWDKNFEDEAVCACSGLPVKGSSNLHGVKFGYCHRFPQAKRADFQKYTGLPASDFDGHKNAFFLLKDIEYYLDRGWILVLFGIEETLRDTFYLSLNQWPSKHDVSASKTRSAPLLDDPICSNKMRWHEWKVSPPPGVNPDDIICWRHLHNFPLTQWPVSKQDNMPAPLSRRVCAVVAAAHIQHARLGGLGPHAQTKAFAGPSPREVLEGMCTPGAARGEMSSVLDQFFARAEPPEQMGPMDEAVAEDAEDMDEEASISAAFVSGLALVDGDDRAGERS